jgi:hypothetical protein
MSWNTIDLGPGDRSHVQARWKDKDDKRYLYIDGSDHWIDWAHHFLPGAQRREIAAAYKLASILIKEPGAAEFVVGGHSLGGAIATAVTCILDAALLPVTGYAFGGKRPPKRYNADVTCYRHRGDLVPFLPPWRPRYAKVIEIGPRKPFWAAHEPREYFPEMLRAGLLV